MSRGRGSPGAVLRCATGADVMGTSQASTALRDSQRLWVLPPSQDCPGVSAKLVVPPLPLRSFVARAWAAYTLEMKGSLCWKKSGPICHPHKGAAVDIGGFWKLKASKGAIALASRTDDLV
jgi:hypothetical protein